MPGIPLRCFLCPNEPRFSDVSHMLTHISSKGHLAHHLQCNLRAAADSAVHARLAQYNAWYLRHDIERLLSRRLATKDARKGRRRLTKQPGSSGRGNRLTGSTIDPYLNGGHCDNDREEPHVHTRGNAALALMQPQGSEVSLQSSPYPFASRAYDDAGPSDRSPALKGVRWPGMSVFDAASAEAQRQRNQRKDVSVLHNMELISAAIEPVECIYWPGGQLKKAREITGEVESTPEPDDSPPSTRWSRPSRRQSQSRQVEPLNEDLFLGQASELESDEYVALEEDYTHIHSSSPDLSPTTNQVFTTFRNNDDASSTYTGDTIDDEPGLTIQRPFRSVQNVVSPQKQRHTRSSCLSDTASDKENMEPDASYLGSSADSSGHLNQRYVWTRQEQIYDPSPTQMGFAPFHEWAQAMHGRTINPLRSMPQP